MMVIFKKVNKYTLEKLKFRNILLLVLSFISLTSFGQTNPDSNDDIIFIYDEGKTFSYKPSFCQRLSGVKHILLLEPNQKSSWDNYLYGCYANYFRQLGLNVKVVSTSDYGKTTGMMYGDPMLWCNFYGNTSDYCDRANSLIVGLSYGTSPRVDDQAVLWVSDVYNNFGWEFRIKGIPNKSQKFIDKLKKTMCSSYHYNENYACRPEGLESPLTENKIKDLYSHGETISIYQGDIYRLGLIEIDGHFALIYLGSRTQSPEWKIGDVKAVLEKTSTPGTYTGKWWGRYKQPMYFNFIISNGTLKTYSNGELYESYNKVFP